MEQDRKSGDREGRIIRERRIELGLTQEETAIELGISLQQYQRYEYGERKFQTAPCGSGSGYVRSWSPILLKLSARNNGFCNIRTASPTRSTR